MERMKHDEIIEVIQAHKDGKEIQYRHINSGVWLNTLRPQWNFSNTMYRIRPEPEPTCWDYPLSRFRGAWVAQNGNNIELPIEGLEPLDEEPIMIGGGWRTKEEAERNFSLIKSTVRP